MKKFFSTKYSDTSFALATLVLRLTFGVLMLPYGYNKLVYFSSKSSTFSDPFHIGHTPSLALVVFAEFFCAVLVILGLLTRLACIPLIITMAVAVFYANHGKIFDGGQTAALFLGGFIAILLVGPGKISADRLIGK